MPWRSEKSIHCPYSYMYWYLPLSSLVITFFKYITMNKRLQHISSMGYFQNLLAYSLNQAQSVFHVVACFWDVQPLLLLFISQTVCVGLGVTDLRDIPEKINTLNMMTESHPAMEKVGSHFLHLQCASGDILKLVWLDIEAFFNS